MITDQQNITQAISGPSVTRSEVENAICSEKSRKPMGPDKIPIEVLKLIGDSGSRSLVDLFNTIFNHGSLPYD